MTRDHGRLTMVHRLWSMDRCLKHRSPRSCHHYIESVFPKLEFLLRIHQRAVSHVVEDIFVFQRAICQSLQKRFEFAQINLSGMMFEDSLNSLFSQPKGQRMKVADIADDLLSSCSDHGVETCA